jgi:hypothetical protein
MGKKTKYLKHSNKVPKTADLDLRSVLLRLKRATEERLDYPLKDKQKLGVVNEQENIKQEVDEDNK